MITITKTGDVWIAKAPFEAKDILKSAGLWWHPSVSDCLRKPCAACKTGIDRRWWTSSIDVAAKLAKYADDSCRHELESFSTKCSESLEASTAVAADIEVPTKLPLFPFQRAGVKFIEDHGGRALVADDMGVGKTPQAIGFLTRDIGRLPAIIVCPASIRIQWGNEIQKFSDLVPEILCRGNTARELRSLGYFVYPDRKPADVEIINYDILSKWIEPILKLNPKTLILDEASAIKEPKSQRSKAAIELARAIPNVILLTGTPLLNRPKELWNLTQAVDPNVFPKFFHFAKKFCAAKETKWGWDFDGASNLGELNKILRQRLMIRREKKDVLKELPEKTRVTVPILLDCQPKDQVKRLKKMVAMKAKYDAWKTELEKLSIDDRKNYLARHAEKAAEMQGLTGFLISEIQDLQKSAAFLKLASAIERVMEMLNEGDAKILIFTHHHDVTDRVLEKLKELQVRCVRIDGRDDAALRQQAVDVFQKDDACRVAVLGIMAAGMGLNLTAANNIVFMEFPWRPADVEQAEARAWRMGQENRVTSYFFVAAGTVEESIAKMLDQKREVTNAAMGETGRTVEEQGILDSVLEDLASAIKF